MMNTPSESCSEKVIRLDHSTTGLQSFKINNNGLFIFHIQVFTYGENILSSLIVNDVEVLQMSSQRKGYDYGTHFYPISNHATMYHVLYLQTDDEVSFKNISGSFINGSFTGWSIKD